MHRRRLGALAVALALVLAATACNGDDDDRASPDAGAGSSTAPATTRPTPDGAPPELAAHPDDWVLPGHDYDNSRAATNSRITKDNVDELDVAWEANVTGPLTTVPLIVGADIYVQDGTGTTYAIARDTGKLRWSQKGAGFNVGPFGTTLFDGRLFAMHGSTGVIARDAKTGAEAWSRDITATPTTGIDIQPVAYDGTVFVSTVPISIAGFYKGGDHGVVHALDAATGVDKWTFDTVDSDDVWGNPSVNSGGGAWYPPAIDAERGVVYWGVANPAPFPGTPEYPNGSSRPGPNLYTDSVVALHLGDGSLDWYHQVTPHDLFDRDLVHTLIARDRAGKPTVIGTGKGGVVVGLDPATGAPRFRTPVGVHENDDMTALEGPTRVAPGTYGGVLTPPATADDVVYVATVDSPVELRPDATAYFGAEMGANPGELTAVDARTGKVRWSVDVPGDPLGGATVVNDLVFTATVQGKVLAYDRSNGDRVWETDAPGGINGWMSVAGDLLVVPVGNAQPPRLVAYRLPGGS